jgi:hypothetical protein
MSDDHPTVQSSSESQERLLRAELNGDDASTLVGPGSDSDSDDESTVNTERGIQTPADTGGPPSVASHSEARSDSRSDARPSASFRSSSGRRVWNTITRRLFQRRHAQPSEPEQITIDEERSAAYDGIYSGMEDYLIDVARSIRVGPIQTRESIRISLQESRDWQDLKTSIAARLPSSDMRSQIGQGRNYLFYPAPSISAGVDGSKLTLEFEGDVVSEHNMERVLGLRGKVTLLLTC